MSDLKPWKIRNTKLLLDYSPWLCVHADTIELPDGHVVHDYLRIEQPDFVVIVPVDQDGKLGLIRSYKHGVGRVDVQPPAGYLEASEDVLTTAQRELLEETGCEAENWHPLGSFVISGNRGTGNAHLFLATDCRQITEPDPGDLEEQEIIWLSLDEAHRYWIEGKFGQIVSIAAIGLALAQLKSNNTDQP